MASSLIYGAAALSAVDQDTADASVQLHRTPPVSHDQDAGEFTWSG
jgi:hypothetical protein